MPSLTSAASDLGGYEVVPSGGGARPLTLAALAAAGPGAGRIAVALGCSAGDEVAQLARCGWWVNGIDPDPSLGPALEELGETLPVWHTCASLAGLEVLPCCHLLVACEVFAAVPRAHFERVWSMMLTALQPGAVLAVELPGHRDDRAGEQGSFLTRREVLELTQRLSVLQLAEGERDLPIVGDTLHAHRFQLLARTW